MNKYLISYDLGLPETVEDYKVLKTYIQSFPLWAKPLQSVWFVISNKKASEIRDEIKLRVDGNDKVLVIEVKGHWATNGISTEVLNWMKNNI
jgi:hypothetical protein